MPLQAIHPARKPASAGGVNHAVMTGARNPLVPLQENAAIR
jgi:hypothetical protein